MLLEPRHFSGRVCQAYEEILHFILRGLTFLNTCITKRLPNFAATLSAQDVFTNVSFLAPVPLSLYFYGHSRA